MDYWQPPINGMEQIFLSGLQQFTSNYPKRKSRTNRKSPSSVRASVGDSHRPKNQKMKVAPTQRRKLYAWVTRIAKLIAGDSHCQYAAWFPTRYQYDKLSSGFDSEKWQSKHDEFLIERAAQLQAEGFTVYIEDANSLKVNGKICDICIAGKPDIIAIKHGQVIVEDCKTGQPKGAHRIQVLIYMLLLSVAPDSRCKGLIPEGRLVYPDGVVDIPSSEVDSEFKELRTYALTGRQPYASELTALARFSRIYSRIASLNKFLWSSYQLLIRFSTLMNSNWTKARIEQNMWFLMAVVSLTINRSRLQTCLVAL